MSEIRKALAFLLDRLSEVELTDEHPKDFLREWMGHVDPAIDRARAALSSASPTYDEGALLASDGRDVETARDIVNTYIRGRRPMETHGEMADAITAALLAARQEVRSLLGSPPSGDICIDCDGSGKYPSGAICKSCDGSGRVLAGDGIPPSGERGSIVAWLRREAHRIGFGNRRDARTLLEQIATVIDSDIDLTDQPASAIRSHEGGV